ncbi:MAG: thioredoxin family protein [Flavobacteriales bacterium]|jgi:thiol:disulfide interchange protein DsbD|nr:thioredoxin family protein [Flavobacteriales bacterium]
MKRILTLLVLLTTWVSFAQVGKVVDWTFDSQKTGEGEYNLIINAEIKDHWHLYSSDLGGAEGPIPTEIAIESQGTVETVGSLKESGTLKKEYDPNFEMELRFFEHDAKFEQKIKIINPDSLVKGYIYFMVCDDKQCLPPEYVDFIFNPKTEKLTLKELVGGIEFKEGEKNPFVVESIDLKKPVIECTVKAEETKGKGFFGVFFLGFLGGLLALLTPCVFPMIPLTVSFFTKGSKDKKKGKKNAFLYGFFIFAIYLILSIPFHVLDNISPDILNQISTSVTLNVIFFVVFIVFAISFFGYFEITMPSSLANKADTASNSGGLIGIFFMALTLAIVSFSCTGPILGSLLAGSLSSDGGAMLLTAGMGGFGLALALPFALFAMFPGMLNSLPSSGGWLNSVKVILGFAEVALAFKFLSNADLVQHWGLVKYEVFYAIWILCALGAAVYLFGWIKFPHDSPLKKITPTRWIIGASFFLFAAYLVTGFRVSEQTETYIPKSLMSGLAPSPGYSIFYPKHCPQGLNCFHDYEEGLAYAKQVNKPVLIDFTGHACVNCRKMEDNVWPENGIKDLIAQDYVLISLYVDDKVELPKDEQMVYKMKSGAVKNIKTIGDKWSTLQTESYGNNSQPWYCLISPDEKLLTSPVGYTPDVEEYKQFLECGLEGFKKSKH